jgi:thiosulfate/3-mercaptopyruvate sulfurtransferase
MDTLVSTQWLAEHLEESDLIVLDCTVKTEETKTGMRNTSGLADYKLAHIPGAGFADLKSDLCDQDNPVEFSVPSPEAFCAAMGKLGVGDNSRVVLYDSGMSMWAARVWWMLRWAGFDRAALLDGGLAAWTAESRPPSSEQAIPTPAVLTPHPRPDLIASKADVLGAIGDPAVALIDTLPPAFYSGEQQMYARAGHIPTAVSECALDVMDETGHLKPQSELDAVFGGDRSARAITYCGGGIMASLSAFAMARSGFTDVAVYTASLQEWAADPSLPMETGSERKNTT